jgi:putative DNA methylase
VLEFNNLFASYKGEGTGAVRHMFSHHILKPERTPIEANLWGTPKSSGSFSTLFKSRLLRALEYRQAATEVTVTNGEKGTVCSPPFTGRVDPWPAARALSPRGVYLSCGDSARTGLADLCIDLVVTDPPFFDNVHYSELADFFHAWRADAVDSCAS